MEKDRHRFALKPTWKKANQIGKVVMYPLLLLEDRSQAIPPNPALQLQENGCHGQGIPVLCQCSGERVPHAALPAPPQVELLNLGLEARSGQQGILFQAQLPYHTQKVSHRWLADKIMLIIKAHMILCTH